MQRQNTSHSKRIRNLIAVCALMAIVLAVSTYAWFVGMQPVNVTSFDVEIKTTESLLLSLDGTSWGTDVTISKDNLETVSYSGHTNNWGKLIPMSTKGEMDATSSRMKLFEKASLTTTPGGYRLMASQVDNYTNTSVAEPEGYVVFDLFVHNMSGRNYIEGLNPLDEEAIYLTIDSAAKVSLNGGVAGTGIENSVRVAFTQIGRVVGTTPAGHASITGATCASSTIEGVKVTGICRNAQIWEPNDRKHVDAAISWYDTSCFKRTGLDVTDPDSYSTTASSCGDVVNGTSYPTYTVSEAIDSEDNIDVYDGAAYNTYLESTRDPATTFLESYAYFTDTMKMLPGVDRPEFMRLAPNSITKLRIYIYIEGQDVDNYDFAQIGKQISINFGFTKQRFIEDDINYTTPALNPEAPVITLTGANPLTIALGTTYVDPGFTVNDNQCDGLEEAALATCKSELAADTVVNDSAVNENVLGSYMVSYIVKDEDGNQTIKTRTVIVAETVPEG